MFAIRAERDYVIQEDFMKVRPLYIKQNVIISMLYLLNILTNIFLCTVNNQAVRKLNDAKKLESSAHYNADFGKE